MKTTSSRLALIAAATSVAAFAQSTPPPAVSSTPAAPASLQDAVTQGKASLNVRLRYETASQDNTLGDAEALTLRTRLGYKTAAYLGFTTYLEAQNTTALIDDYGFPGGTGEQSPANTSVIADPEITDVSQAWLAFAHEKTTATVGRQNLVLDNARFIGNVAWRQNYQTFDAVVLKDTTFDKLTLTYGYLWGINRIFGDGPAAFADYESDSHVINASYAGLPFGTLTGYAYLLDFTNANAAIKNNSTATYGASFVGGAPLADALKLTYRAEYATQSDYGSSAIAGGYTADYYLGEIGVVVAKKYGASIGYEVLGSDNNQGFRTPLATLHAFNGWADLFLGTPSGGLTDLYFKVSAELPYNFSFLGLYHQFESDVGGRTYGDEVDLQLVYKVNKRLSLLAKAAFYDADKFGVDTERTSVQADFAF